MQIEILHESDIKKHNLKNTIKSQSRSNLKAINTIRKGDNLKVGNSALGKEILLQNLCCNILSKY